MTYEINGRYYHVDGTYDRSWFTICDNKGTILWTGLYCPTEYEVRAIAKRKAR
jgi:hypothetical protein